LAVVPNGHCSLTQAQVAKQSARSLLPVLQIDTKLLCLLLQLTFVAAEWNPREARSAKAAAEAERHALGHLEFEFNNSPNVIARRTSARDGTDFSTNNSPRASAAPFGRVHLSLKFVEVDPTLQQQSIH